MEVTMTNLTAQQRLEAVRALERVTPVCERHVPQWFHDVLMRTYGHQLRDVPPAFRVRAAAGLIGRALWLDYWGSTVLEGKLVFAAEPLSHMVDLIEPQRFADELGLALTVTDNAWRCPSWSTRLVFWPTGYWPKCGLPAEVAA
jgi:hypothetical protein